MLQTQQQQTQRTLSSVHNLQLHSYVKRFEDAAPVSLINSIHKVIYDNKENFSQAGTIGPNGESEYDREIRSVETYNLQEKKIGASVAKRVIYNDLIRVTNQLQSIYNDQVPYSTTQKDFDFNFLWYQASNKGHYGWHTDHSQEHAPRTYTVILGLNDDYLGGELKIINDNFSYKIRKNQAIMFPSNFAFPHKVEPVVEGERKVLVIWMN
jgi:hypothetical protein